MASCSAKQNLNKIRVDAKNTILIQTDQWYEYAAPLYISLMQDGNSVEGPTFIGSCNNLKIAEFRALVADDIVYILWAKGNEEKVVYLYSTSDKVGWPMGEDTSNADERLGIGNRLLKIINRTRKTNYSLGEVE